MESDAGLERAARELDSSLRERPWFVSVGIGRTEAGNTLFVYVTTLRSREVSRIGDKWRGYKVVVRPVGRLRALI